MKEIIINFLIFSVGGVFSRSITLLMLPMISRELSISEYGVYELCIVTIALISPVASLLIHESLLRYCLKNRSKYIKLSYLKTALLISFILAVVSLIVTLLLYVVIGDSLVLFLSSLMILMIWFEIFAKYLKGDEKNLQFIIISIVQGVATLGTFYYLVHLKSVGITDIFVSQIIGYVIGIVISLFFVNLYDLNKINFTKRRFITSSYSLVALSVPLIPNAIMWWIFSFSDRWVIGYFGSEEDLGIYAIAAKYSAILVLVTSVLMQVTQQYVHKLKVFDGKEVTYLIAVNISILSLVSMLMLLISREFLDYILGSTFGHHTDVANIYVVSTFLLSASSLLGIFYVAIEKTTGALHNTVIAGIVNLIAGVILIPIFGLYGALLSSVMSGALLVSLRLKYFKEIVNWNSWHILTQFMLIILVLILSIYNSLLALLVLLLNLILFIWLFIKMKSNFV